MEETKWNHGMTGYQKHKCRCDVCRSAHTDYARAWMERPGNREKANTYRREREARIRALSGPRLPKGKVIVKCPHCGWVAGVGTQALVPRAGYLKHVREAHPPLVIVP